MTGTPGRLDDLISTNHLDLSQVTVMLQIVLRECLQLCFYRFDFLFWMKRFAIFLIKSLLLAFAMLSVVMFIIALVFTNCICIVVMAVYVIG